MSFDPLRSSTGISEVTVDAMGAMVSEHCNRVTVAAPHSFRVMPVTTGAEAVSYTHLDVYKRQVPVLPSSANTFTMVQLGFFMIFSV